MKKLFAFLFSIIVLPAVADNCLQYKRAPEILLNSPDWSKTVVQSTVPMDLWHGNVIATLQDKYDVLTEIKPVDDGYCVVLKSVGATVGYSEFLVQIDMRHTPNTCPYNAVLKHEEKHVQTYLSVMDDFRDDFQDAVFVAADSIMPIWIAMRDDADRAVDMMNNELQSHPDLILVKQKLHAAEEIKNKQVDRDETGADLANCFE